MGFFKTKKDAVEFSQIFYERSLFEEKVAGVELVSVYAETVYRTICKEDPSFAPVQLPKLIDEMLGLQLEMIGTAWTHHSNEPAAIANSDFTKKYLTDKGRSDLWPIMGEYNQRVAASSIYGADRSTRMGRARIVSFNKLRMDTYEAWHELGGYDGEAIARVANRLGSETAWKKGVTLRMVGIRAMLRLDIEGTDLIGERLAMVAFGFYQGAKEALDGVKLVAA